MKVVKEGYAVLAIPKKMQEKIKGLVNSPDSLYTSVADFAKEAIREKLERLEGLKRKV